VGSSLGFGVFELEIQNFVETIFEFELMNQSLVLN
jgi:hypothetical protein